MSENLGYVAPGERIGVGTPPPKPGTPTGGTKKKKSGGTSAPVETPVEETEPVELGPAKKELITDDGAVLDEILGEYGAGTGGTGTTDTGGTGTKAPVTDGTTTTGTGTTNPTGTTTPTGTGTTDPTNPSFTSPVDGMSTTAPDIQKSQYADTAVLENLLKEQMDVGEQQMNNTIDRAVQTGAEDLNRALDDAADAYQTERNQVARDAAIAEDNSALYAEMRGDDGGVGRAQYDAIANTAAQNQLAINQQQTQLASDTARQIADLRAQGEFDKADKLLELTQNYLGQLISIEQWGQQYNLSVDQINQAIDQWKANYEKNAEQFIANYKLSEAGLTGEFGGVETMEKQKLSREESMELLSLLATYKVKPTEEQLAFLDLTPEQAEAVAKKVKSGNGGGGRRGGGGSSGTKLTLEEEYSLFKDAGAGGYSDFVANAAVGVQNGQHTYQELQDFKAANERPRGG